MFCEASFSILIFLSCSEFAGILLGTDMTAEAPNLQSPHKLRRLLIHRVNHLSDQLAVETLRLFQALLKLSYQPIIDTLIVRNFQRRQYLDVKKFQNLSFSRTSSMRSNSSKTKQQAEKVDNESESDENTTVAVDVVQVESKTDNDESLSNESAVDSNSEPSVEQIVEDEKPVINSDKTLQENEESSDVENVDNDDHKSDSIVTTPEIDDYDSDDGSRCTISLGGVHEKADESKDNVVDSNSTAGINASYQHDDAFSISDQGTPGGDATLEDFDLSRGFNKRRVEKAVNG